MMYLIPEPVATKQLSGIAESSSPSKSYQHAENSSSPYLRPCAKSPRSSHRRRYYSSDEEDDSRDRQSHWKRTKTHYSDDNPRGSSTRNLIRFTERDHERSPSRTRHESSNPRVVVLKHERDGRRWDAGAVGIRVRDGGTTSKDIDSGANNKRKHHESMSSSMMVREQQLTARRVPVERGYEIRVGGHRKDDGSRSSLFLEESRHARIGSDVRERETRVYGNHTGERFCSDVGLRVRRVEFDNGRVHGTTFDGSAMASVGGAKGGERVMGLERRQEKRERWAEKERDLEKELEEENMLKSTTTTTTQPMSMKEKSVTVVDYSHKFALAKAPISTAAKLVEVDHHRLCQRQKQIDYGKNTLGYERYTETVPRYQRTKEHPRTPDIRQVCSKRSWDGQIRKWRRLLHEYDPPKDEEEEDPEQMLAPRKEQDKSSTDDVLMMDRQQAEHVDDPDMKIYEGWSDDEC